MKKKVFAMTGLAVAAGCALSMGAASAALAATSANNIKASDGASVYKISATKGSAKYDIDKNGTKDKVSFKYTKNKDNKDAYASMKMTINGKTVTVAKKGYFYKPTVTFMRTANNTGFIYINALSESDHVEINKVYRYQDGKITYIFNPTEAVDTFKDYSTRVDASISGVKKNNFVVSVSAQLKASGITNFKYEFFKMADSEAGIYAPVKDAVKASSMFMKTGGGKVTYSPTTKELTLYSDAATTKKSTTLKKGTSAKVVGVNITAFDKPTLKVKTKSGKTGWIKVSKKTQLFKYAAFAG